MAEQSTTTKRTVLTDSNGKLWDLGNPNIVGIQSASSGAATTLNLAGGNQITGVAIAFVDASNTFSAS